MIPAKLRQRFGLKEGSLVIAEETSEGILIRPAVARRVVDFKNKVVCL